MSLLKANRDKTKHYSRLMLPGILQAKPFKIPHAQILTLSSTPFVVLPALPNSAPLVEWGYARISPGTAYGNLGSWFGFLLTNDVRRAGTQNNTAVTFFGQALEQFAIFQGEGNSQLNTIYGGEIASFSFLTTTPVLFKISGVADPTGGDPTRVVTGCLYYREFALEALQVMAAQV